MSNSPTTTRATGASTDRGFVEVAGVSKVFASQSGGGSTFQALDDVNLSVEKGTMLALVGPSGSGKTTLLRCIAGLETPTSGEIRIRDVSVYSSAPRVLVPTNRRNIGMIFQNYALWPHLTVGANVEYPLARRRVPAKRRRAAAREYLDLVGCGHLFDRHPHQISGGQQQRVALARTLVYEPDVVLFDEPLSNVDLTVREQLRRHIHQLQTTLGFTGVFVTHDQAEAFFIGDRVAVMRDGRVLQADTASAVHSRPASLVVAAFSGAGNQISGVARQEGGRWYIDTAELGGIDITDAYRSGDVAEGVPVVLATRPEWTDMTVADEGGRWSATVTDAIDLGATWEYVVALSGGQTWRCHTDRRRDQVPVGSTTHVVIRNDGCYVFRAE